MLDFRVSGYIKNPSVSKDIEYWIGHSFLCIPLAKALYDISKFIRKNPTEVIVIEFRGDWSPVNADNFYKTKKASNS